MPDKTGKGIDRRDLIKASIATVSAAALAASAGPVFILLNRTAPGGVEVYSE